MINFIDNDGMMKGLPTKMIQKLTNLTKVPIIVLGGIGNFQHVVEVFNSTTVSAVACSSIFHFGSNDPIRLKSYLKNNGIQKKFKMIGTENHLGKIWKILEKKKVIYFNFTYFINFMFIPRISKHLFYYTSFE